MLKEIASPPGAEDDMVPKQERLFGSIWVLHAMTIFKEKWLLGEELPSSQSKFFANFVQKA